MKHIIQHTSFNSGIGALLQSNQLPASDLQAGLEVTLFSAGPTLSPHGVVGAQVFGSAALLRSLAVSPSERCKGLGGALLRHAERHLAFVGVSAIYLLTTTAEPFFVSHGYRIASRHEAPASIAATGQFASLCPASSAFMVKLLRAQQGAQADCHASASLRHGSGLA